MMKTREQKQDSGELSPPKSPCQAAPCPNGILVVTNVSGDCLGTGQETLSIFNIIWIDSRDSNEGYPKVRNHGEGPY